VSGNEIPGERATGEEKSAVAAERSMQLGAGSPSSLEDNMQCPGVLFVAIESAHMGAPVDVHASLGKHLDSAAR
jgi:hypothetical protein